MPASKETAQDRKGPSRRYSAFVGLAFLVLIAVATLNTIKTGGGGTLGTGSDERNMALPEFAVPNAVTGPLDNDANIYQDDCSTSQNPCPTSAQHPSACQIPRAGAIRVCDFFNRPLVLSFWFTREANCLPTQDKLSQLASRYRGRVNFLSIDVRDDPQSVRNIAEEHHWKMPVGYDRDGAVSDLYRVGGCPTVAFAYPGGILSFAKIGNAASGPRLAADVRRLIHQSAHRASESR